MQCSIIVSNCCKEETPLMKGKRTLVCLYRYLECSYRLFWNTKVALAGPPLGYTSLQLAVYNTRQELSPTEQAVQLDNYWLPPRCKCHCCTTEDILHHGYHRYLQLYSWRRLFWSIPLRHEKICHCGWFSKKLNGQ